MLNKNTMLQNFLLEKGGHVHGKKLQTNFSRRFNFHRILKVFVKQLNSFMLISRRKNSVKVRYQTDQFGGKFKMSLWKWGCGNIHDYWKNKKETQIPLKLETRIYFFMVKVAKRGPIIFKLYLSFSNGLSKTFYKLQENPKVQMGYKFWSLESNLKS